jgi:hypothetical protein
MAMSGRHIHRGAGYERSGGHRIWRILGNRIADDIEAGGDKDANDILDEMGVPTYDEEC